MKACLSLPLLAFAVVSFSGCQTYEYRVVQPPGVAQVVAREPVTIHYAPLDYHLARHQDRLAMRIINPTDDKIVLQGPHSYVVDPKGESHPVRGRVLAPHSFTWMLLPPIPPGYPYYYAADGGWGWGWGWGWGYDWYDPFWGPFYAPMVSCHRVFTPYDWTWKTGPARLHLGYDQNGKRFEQNFEFVREREK